MKFLLYKKEFIGALLLLAAAVSLNIAFRTLENNNLEAKLFFWNRSVSIEEGCMSPIDPFEIIQSNTEMSVTEHLVYKDGGINSASHPDKAVATFVPDARIAIDGAEWIWDSQFVTEPKYDEKVTFRKDFDLDVKPQDACLQIVADNTYVVTVNGVIVAQKHDRDIYNTVNEYKTDLAEYLTKGTNTIEVSVMNYGVEFAEARSNPAGVSFKLQMYKKGYEKAEPLKQAVFVPASSARVEDVGYNNISFSWDPVKGSVGYGVYVFDNLIATTTASTFEDNDVLLPGIEYRYKVLAVSDWRDAAEEFQYLNKNNTFVQNETIGSRIVAFASKFLVHNVKAQSEESDTVVQKTKRRRISPTGVLRVFATTWSFKGGVDNLVTREDMQKSIERTADYYAEASFGKLTIDKKKIDIHKENVVVKKPNDIKDDVNFFEFIEGVTDGEGLAPEVLDSVSRKIRSQNKEYSTKNYEILTFVSPDMGGSVSGVGFALDGSLDQEEFFQTGVVMINGRKIADKNHSTLIHEIGHVIGLYHSNAILCSSSLPNKVSNVADCEFKSYLDPTSAMGNITNHHFNAYGKSSIGWIDVKNIDVSGMYTIVPTSGAVNGDIPQATTISLRLQDGKKDEPTYDKFKYLLDYRIEKGFDVVDHKYDWDETLYLPVINGVALSTSFPYLSTVLNYYAEDTYIVYNDRKIVVTKDGAYYEVSQGDSYIPFKIIQLSHDNNGARIYVRFDEETKLEAKPTEDGKVKLTWNKLEVAPTGGYEVFRNSTTTPYKTIQGKDVTEFIDTDTKKGTEYKYWVRPFDAFEEIEDKRFPMPISEEVKATPEGGLVGYWKFDGNAIDQTGNGNNGSLAGGATYASGKFGQALSLNSESDIDGNNGDYVKFGSSPEITNLKNVTVSMWIKPEGEMWKADWRPNSHFGSLIGKTNNSNVDFGMTLYRSPVDSGYYAFASRSLSSGYFPTYSKAGAIRIGNWYHLTGTYDDSTKKVSLYINGVLVSETIGHGSIKDDSRYDLIMGAYSLTGNNSSWYNGLIDEVKMYDKVLSPEDVYLDYVGASNPLLVSYNQ